MRNFLIGLTLLGAARANGGNSISMQYLDKVCIDQPEIFCTCENVVPGTNFGKKCDIFFINPPRWWVVSVKTIDCKIDFVGNCIAEFLKGNFLALKKLCFRRPI